MTVAHLIEHLQARAVTPSNPEKVGGVTAQNTPISLVSLVKLPAVTPVTPVTPQKVERQSENQKSPLDWTPSPPLPDPGLARLLALAMAYCEHIGAGDKARKDWHTDIEATPVEQRGELAAYLRSQLPTPKPKAMPPAVVASPSPPVPAQTWREADKADQLHYWNCAQCLAVVKSGTGKRCTTGQQLHDAYIEAATREGRFIGATSDRAKPLPKFSVHQPWNEADRAYQAHHWNCTSCKAAARSGGHSQRCTEGQHLYELYKQAFEAGAGKVHGTPAQRIGKRG